MDAISRTFDSYVERQTEMIEQHEAIEKQGECAEDRNLIKQTIKARDLAQSLIHLKLNQSDLDSNKLHIMKVSTDIDRTQTALDKLNAETDEMINGVEKYYQEKIQEDSKLEPGQYDAEIRQIVRPMSIKDRNELMNDSMMQQSWGLFY